jgi:hypothetical protein
MATAPTGVFHPSTRPWPSPTRIRWTRALRRLAVGLAILLAIVMLASVAADEPLRRTMERRINAQLDGYTATIGHANLRILGLGLDLRDVTVVQNSQPHPPVIYIPSWKTTVQWRALLSAALVADVTFTRPAFYLTFYQADVEARDPKPATEKGWQDAVESVYPLEINKFRITDGTLDYFDTGEVPVRLRSFSVDAENIRNVKTKAGTYPSPFELEATMADGARLTFDGNADFLATPHATLRGDMALSDLMLKGLAPALRHANVDVAGGKLAARGRVEYTPTQLLLALDSVRLDGAKIDYVVASAADEQAVRETAKNVTTAETHPANRVDVKEAVVAKGTFGLVSGTSKPPYRVFVTDTEARVRDFSNQATERRGSATLRGRFMGTGPIALDADFAPAAKQADFHMNARVEDVDLPAMNDVLRAQAGVDVAGGRLSVYSELTVRGGRVDGYVKPLFKDLDVYDREQDRGKNPLRQAYEAIVGATSTVLENRQREEVATITDLSGPIERPNTSTLEIIGGLLRNAFIKAIMPGLEQRRR